MVPVIAFSAWSGTGKTTLIEKLIPLFLEKGIRVAVLKHDAHNFEIDYEGKDSYRFAHAGADTVIISSGTRTAAVIGRSTSIEDQLRHLEKVDLAIVEGYNDLQLPRIAISRKETGKGFRGEIQDCIALVTDEEGIQSEKPVFHPDEAEKIRDFIIGYMQLLKPQNVEKDFTHFDESGRARMVDVGEKDITHRTATAAASVLVNRETYNLIQSGGMKKGDVLTVAQIAGIMGAKRTPDLIPMCHPIGITGIKLKLELNDTACAVDIFATVSCDGKTGVEMEALTAASVAALTVYDMCKAVQKDMVITQVRLLDKTGGIHGDYHRRGENQ